MIQDHDVDDLGFGVGFTQLNTCRKAPKDLFPKIVDVRTWVGQALKEGDEKSQGRISSFVQERLNDQQREALSQLMR